MPRKHYNITGEVQGVGFRWFTQGQAEGLGVSGWVRNEPDGSVQAEAQGSPDKLEQFESALQRGPGSGQVRKVESDEIKEQDGEEGFRIRH